MPAGGGIKGRGLGHQVRRLRLARKLTLRDAERLTGVSRSMLSKIERNLASPTATILGKLAEGLKVSISQLVGGPAATRRRRTLLLRKKEQPVLPDYFIRAQAAVRGWQHLTNDDRRLAPWPDVDFIFARPRRG